LHDGGGVHGRENESVVGCHPDAAEFHRIDSDRGDDFPQKITEQ
jgi:hypothetical protein